MQSTTKTATVSADSTEPDPGLVTAIIGRLRAEHELADAPALRALLLHEIALLEERMGDEGAAARDELSAVNEQPDFREPLEQLIAIIQRRQSYKNLGKLLERLVKVSEAPEEVERAQLDNAANLARFEKNPQAAKEALEQALELTPESAPLWYALEVIAGKLEDDELRQHALQSRVELTQHSTWRALLAIDLGRLAAQAGNIELAVGSLQKAIDQASPATFLAARALEQLARSQDRQDLLASALETQATLIERTLKDESAAESLGVPKYQQNDSALALCWFGAAEAQRARGDMNAAAALLDKALAHVESEPAILHARLNAAESTGDTATTARLSQLALQAGATGKTAAALWLRVAEAAASEGDGPAALAAVKSALQQDAASIPARALELDLLSGGADGAALASSLEETAAQLPTDEGKARYYLMAAHAWARRAGESQGAKAALSQAGMFGTPPASIARIARLLASAGQDLAWYDEATKRLIAAGAEGPEKLSLYYELARLRVLRGEVAGARDALSALSELAEGDWLGNVLAAYLLPPSSEQEDAALSACSALEKLGAAETEPATRQALLLATTLRRAKLGNVAGAEQMLAEMHRDDPGKLVPSLAFAQLLRHQGKETEAARVLADCAQGQPNDPLAAALLFEAGLLHWHSDNRKAATECFTKAQERDGNAGGLLLGWALRASDPNDLNARRQALESGTPSPLLALERFGLEAGVGRNLNLASDALDAVDDTAAHELRDAAALARALLAGDSDQEQHAAVLKQLALLDGDAKMVALGAEHCLELEQAQRGKVDAHKLERTSSAWAAEDPSLVAGLEWLGAAVASGDHQREVQARRAIAQRLDPKLGPLMEASASLLNTLLGGEHEPLLASSEPGAQLANLELAPPGSDPRRRAAAMLGAGNGLGDESGALCRALGAYNHLCLGNAEQAMQIFRGVVEAFPEDVIGWYGLHQAATITGDRSAVAEACAALGDATTDDAEGAKYWEEAALILIDELDDPERGEFALARTVERDVTRFVAFDRLFRIVRARKDGPQLLELIARRLEVAEEPEELAKLFWERARVLRQSKDYDGALAALENVTMLEADHVGALALSGEIHLSTKQFPEAAEKLSKLASLDEAPERQRLMSGIAAVDIYEKRLGDTGRAFEVLSGLHDAGLSTLPVRERLAKSAATNRHWETATAVLEQLMVERETREGRIDAARLAMVIYRDELQQPPRARDAVTKLLGESPSDGEALELVLSDMLPADQSAVLLQRGEHSLIHSLVQEPIDAEGLDRLARIALKLEDAPLRQAALGALVAVGEGSREIDAELAQLDQRVAHVPQMAIGNDVLPELADAQDSGAIVDLMQILAPTLAEALGPSLATFGVSRRQKVSPRAGLPIRNEIAAWAGALGLGDFDLYVGGPEADGVFGVATETPALIVGSNVSAPLSAQHRALVARELFALRRGTSILRHRESTDIAAIVVAAGNVVGIDIPSPQYAMLGEFTRQLSKEMPRKVKRSVSELAQHIANAGEDPIAWYRAAISSLDRMATIAAGDVSWVLASSASARGMLGASIEAHKRAQRLLSFVLSPSYLGLRQKLGMGVR